MRFEMLGYELILQKVKLGLKFVSEEEYARREARVDEELQKNKILRDAGYPKEMWE